MLRRPGRLVLIAVLALLLLLVAGRAVAELYTDILWYGEVGYRGSFLRRMWISVGIRGAASVLGAAVIFLNLWFVSRQLGPVRVRRRYGNLEIAERVPRRTVLVTAGILSLLGGWWLAEMQFHDQAALGVAAWARGVGFGIQDPVFGHDAAFYVFTVPVLVRMVDFLLLAAVWSLALVALGHVLVGGIRWEEGRLELARAPRRHLAVLLAGMILLLGVRYLVGRYLLMVEGTGIGGGIGFTDANARLPAHLLMAGLSVVSAVLLVRGAWRNSITQPVLGLGLLILGAVVAGAIWPAVIQNFRVEPNELSREAPFIRWNMAFTRTAYGLNALETRSFPYQDSSRPDEERLQPLLARLPLWDTRPLREAFEQTESLRAYYHFPGVDYDRYGPPGQERQVGIGVREFSAENLQDGNPSWQSLRLNPEYIRGLGAVVAPAHRTASDDAPALWLRSVRPVIRSPSSPPGLELTHPSVYFGESLDDYAIVVPGRDSTFDGQPGVDQPRGVPLSSFARVLAFSWRLGDVNLLFSGEVDRTSRLILRRSLQERLEAVAPFILWDPDALPVIQDGRIVWMVDGYTASASFPLSRGVTLGQTSVRYLRAAVKGTIDAVTGATTIHVVDPADPLIRTYQRLFPALLRPLEAMPAELRRHLRYPELMLVTQAEILQEYHVERPEVFYTGEDMWERPQEAAPTGGLIPYRPTYALMPLPREEELEYLATLPFIARSRQNMTGLLVARNDPGRYGDLILYRFPTDQQVPGPGQVQALIEQDPVISPELSLLRQRGTGIDMGHLRLIPLDSSVLYVQPLFLSADENPIPALWRVVVSDGENVGFGDDLYAALATLDLPVSARDTATAPATGGWPTQALRLLDAAEASLRDGDWEGYGRRLEQLRRLLSGLQGGGPSGADPAQPPAGVNP